MATQVTEQHIQSCKRHAADGHVWYSVPSATDESIYMVSFTGRFRCNCKNGRDNAIPYCWHYLGSLEAEHRYQDGTQEATTREQKAVKRNGMKAYERKAFSFMR